MVCGQIYAPATLPNMHICTSRIAVSSLPIIFETLSVCFYAKQLTPKMQILYRFLEANLTFQFSFWSITERRFEK